MQPPSPCTKSSGIDAEVFNMVSPAECDRETWQGIAQASSARLCAVPQFSHTKLNLIGPTTVLSSAELSLFRGGHVRY